MTNPVIIRKTYSRIDYVKNFIKTYDSNTYFKPRISERKLDRMASRLIKHLLENNVDGGLLTDIYERVK